MDKHFFKLFLGYALTLILGVATAYGQTVTGTITGEVVDPSGAVVPGATVVAHNLGTGVDTSAATNTAGFYRIEFLPIGHYQVIITAPGFQKATVAPFDLEVLQTANFNVKLTLGSTSATVSVSAAAPILNTDNPTISATFTANTIANMPLNGLDFSALTLYMPGSVNTNGTGGMSSIERSQNWSDLPNVNGNRAQANNYAIEGVDMNENYNNLIAYSPAPEALEEMKVITANSPADYGNVNGAGVVLMLKSGTNHFHGSAYYYVQDYQFNANSYTNKQSGTAKNPFTQSQFGGTIGGPIFRNKLFFFADYLGARKHSGGYGTASVIPDAMRNGDFSALLSASNPIQLYDPENNFAAYSGNKGVPINNPVAKYLFAHPSIYPNCGASSPTVPANGKCLTPTDGIAKNNYAAPEKYWTVNNQGDAKLEYDLSNRDKVTGFYSMSTSYDGQAAVMAITFPGQNQFPTWLLGTTWVHTFNASLINAARIGFTRTKWAEGVPIDGTGLFGTNGNAVVGITFPDQGYQGFTNQSISGVSSVGTSAYNGNNLIDNTYSYSDSLTWQRGLHFLSMGVTGIRYQNNYPNGNNDGFLGSLNYSGNFSANPSATNGGGYGVADFVLDRVQSGGVTLGSVNVGQRQWRFAGYINDDYRVMPKLTVNIGLRWEYDQPWIEQNNKTGNIDLKTGQILYAGNVPYGAPADSGVCSNRACYQANHRQWMPHLGFNYQVNDRTVVRAGYGATSFYEGNSFNQRLTAIYPFMQAISFNITAPAVGAVTTPSTAEDGFTGGTLSYNGSNLGYTAYPQNIQPAYVQNWNLTGEYAITRTLSLQAGYVGEIGQHIEDYGNVNQYKTNGDPTSAPYYNNKYIGVNGVASALAVGSGGLLITESRAMMRFNALEATLRQRLVHGLEYTINYTYGQAMTNSYGNYSLNVSGYSGAFQNYYNSHADYGAAGYDVRHNLSGSGVYTLPFGRGQKFMASDSRIADEIFGGWKVATTFVAYSGFPETITGGSNNANSYGSGRANQYRKLKVTHRTNANWFGTDASAKPCTAAGVDNGTCAFGVPAVNAFGSSHNGAFRSPGYFNLDLSAFKDFHTYRDQTIGFRFDAFNAFNIVSYGNPDTGVSDTNFGNVSLQTPRSTERRLQFALHYNF
jgi:hypothetical protein